MPITKKSESTVSHTSYSLSDDFVNYWTLHGLFDSYRGLKHYAKSSADKKRLTYLRKQILWSYIKNFFFFPVWLVKLLIPSYFKGKNNLWTNLKTIATGKEFKPLRLAVICQVFFLYAIAHLAIVVFYYNAVPTFAATYTWTQSSWTGGVTTTPAIHPGNRTGWNRYSSASSTISADTNVRLTPSPASTSHSIPAHFASGSFLQTTSTVVSGITLTGISTAVNAWETVLMAAPGNIFQYSQAIRNGTDDHIYVLAGTGSTGFYRYSISGNSWTILNPLPGAAGPGLQMIRNGSDDDIYVLRGSSQTSFYRYSISGNSWTTLTVAPGTIGTGAQMFRAGSSDFIYVTRGGSQTSFYRYSISGNSWTTLTVAPGTIGGGSKMLSNGTNDYIYVYRGNDLAGFYRYSISGNSWTTLASVTSSATLASEVVWNGTDDYIYVFNTDYWGGGSYRYSISSNTWSSMAGCWTGASAGLSPLSPESVRVGDFIYYLTGKSNELWRYSVSGNTCTQVSTPLSTGNGTGAGALMIGGDADYLYVLGGNSDTTFYRYSISGNSWVGTHQSSITPVPGTVGSGAQMIRNGSDDDIYVLRGNTTNNFYKYIVSTNSWTTLTAVPATVGIGAQMIRNGSDDDIYVLRGNGQTGFYKYSISGNSWTTLTAVPGTIAGGGTMIRNGSDDDIYVLRGGATNNLYKYSISGNSWTTLTSAPVTISGVDGKTMVRNDGGSGDYLYVWPGGNAPVSLLRYSISSNSWTTLASIGTLGSGSVSMQLDHTGTDGVIYGLRTSNANGIYRFTVSTGLWSSISSAPGTFGAGVGLERNGSDDYIYVLRGNITNGFYRYSVAGNSWTSLAGTPGTISTGAVLNVADNEIFVLQGGNSTGFYRYTINRVVYDTSGTFTSPVIDTQGNSGFTTLDFDGTTPSNTTLTVNVRAGDTVSPDGTWTQWSSAIADGGSLSNFGSKRYIQYRVNLATATTLRTPVFSGATVNYGRYTSGSLISSPFNAGDATNVLGSIAWTASTSAGTVVKFQVRSSPNNSSWSAWTGPDGTSGSYFTDSSGAQDMPGIFNDGNNDQWMQYRVTLEGNGSDTPTLSSATFSYVVNAPPDIAIVTSTPLSLSSLGVVAINYQVRDLDTATGATPGSVSVDLQYCTSNCSSVGNETWATAATSTLTGNFGSGITVNGAEYANYSLVWDARAAYPNQYNGTNFKIRLRANDSEAANNIGVGESNVFVLDTKNPTATISIDGRSDSPFNLTINADDDTLSGLQMKLSNNSDLSSDGLNSNSGQWIAYTATSTWDFPVGGTTVYYQLRDAYGNISAAGGISSAMTPEVPANMIYQDVSNSETSEWREFLAWEVVPEPGSGFQQYRIYRSTDGSTYTQLTTISDRLENYYIDAGLSGETTYYYRIVAEDSDGNISNYSVGISDKPDGQGGSDVTLPTISNVTSTNIGTQTATIVWDTDELSDSFVDYIIEEGGDFTAANSVGFTSLADRESSLGSHSVTLTGLEPGRTYFYRVRSNDPQGNEGIGINAPNGFTFTTQLGPSISEVQVMNVSNSHAEVTWTTDQMSDSYVYYSIDPTFASSSVAGRAEDVASHSVILEDLVLNTTYYYYVRSGVGEDKNVVDGEIMYYVFTTTGDVDAPEITFDPEIDVGASDSEIEIYWITDEPARATVEYGTNDEYGTTIRNDNFNTDHTFGIEDLLPGTVYYFRIASEDQNGNLSSAIEFTATTVDTADYVPPVISDVSASVVTDDEALIEWKTDEGATGIIYYGTETGNYAYTSDLISTYNRAHAITLTGLPTSTKYYYIVASVDSSGNGTTSTEFDFTTLEKLSQETEVKLREQEAAAIARAEGFSAGQSVIPRSSGGDRTDKVAPIIRNTLITEITGESAVVTWDTDEAGDSIVEFGVTQAHGRAAVNLVDGVGHRIVLIDLQPNTTYYYRVSSADEFGNRSKFETGNFTTGSGLDGIAESLDSPDLSPENAEELFLASIQKASDIIRSMSTRVSVNVLESSLLQQTKVIEELSKVLPLPIIGGQPVVETGATYAIVSWTTDKLSNSLVEYAPADQFLLTNAYDQTVGSFDISTNEHTVEVKGVRPNTTYHYRVISKTPTGAETKSRDFTFKTKNEFSEIGSYKAEVISPEEASFFWVTNLPSNSVLSYIPYRNGIPDMDSRKIVRAEAFATEHLLTVDGLESGVVYDIELSGTDYGGNTVSKLIKGFTTNDTDLPPVIYQIQTDSAIIPGGKEKIQVIISWSTNELSTSRVLYRQGFAPEGTEFTEATSEDTSYVKRHIMVISNFEPGSVYQFAVESTDSSGNTSQSKTITILTPQKEQSVFQVIMSNVEDMFSWVGKIRR